MNDVEWLVTEATRIGPRERGNRFVGLNASNELIFHPNRKLVSGCLLGTWCEKSSEWRHNKDAKNTYSEEEPEKVG